MYQHHRGVSGYDCVMIQMNKGMKNGMIVNPSICRHAGVMLLSRQVYDHADPTPSLLFQCLVIMDYQYYYPHPAKVSSAVALIMALYGSSHCDDPWL